MASVRDILQERTKPGRDEETVSLIKSHFDHVLVHGDPNFIALPDTFPLAELIADKVLYTGLVTGPAPSPADDSFDIVVSGQAEVPSVRNFFYPAYQWRRPIRF